MSSTSRTVLPLIDHVCEQVIASADALTALDRAIGDADHGLNMERGFLAVRERLPQWDALSPGAMITEAGKTLVMTVGGASGPLYGTLFMRLGQELALHDAPGPADVARALRVAIEAVKVRGKAQTGQKTMLDVLEPLQQFLEREDLDAWQGLGEVVESAAQATIPMRAERGRASFLGERSRGHMDPGARSSALIAQAAWNAWQEQRAGRTTEEKGSS